MRRLVPLLTGAVLCTVIVGCHPALDSAPGAPQPPAAAPADNTSPDNTDGIGPYTSISPVRLYDSRARNAETAGQLLPGRVERITLTKGLGVPATARSLVVRVNATTAQPAFIYVFADGKPQPAQATVTISDTTVDSRQGLVALHGSLALSLTTSAAAQLTIDLLGYIPHKPAGEGQKTADNAPNPADSAASDTSDTRAPGGKQTPASRPAGPSPTGSAPVAASAPSSSARPGRNQTASSSAPTNSATPPEPDQQLPSWQQEMLSAINAARSRAGVPHLQAVPCVSSKVATRWAADAAAGADNQGFRLESVKQICPDSHGATGLSASGTLGPKAVVNSWLGKPSLAKQLLSKHINGAGLGRSQSGPSTYWSFVGVEKVRASAPPLSGTRRGVHYQVTETSTGSGVVTRWPCSETITVRLVGHYPTGAPSALSQAVAHIRTASKLPLVVGAPVAERTDTHNVIEVGYGPEGTLFRGKPIPQHAAGVGGPKWLSSGRIFRGDVLVRSDHPAANPTTASGLQVLAHELAHTLGIGHAMAGQTEIMAPQTTPRLAARLQAQAAAPGGSFWGRGDRSALRIVGCER